MLGHALWSVFCHAEQEQSCIFFLLVGRKQGNGVLVVDEGDIGSLVCIHCDYLQNCQQMTADVSFAYLCRHAEARGGRAIEELHFACHLTRQGTALSMKCQILRISAQVISFGPALSPTIR